MNNGLHGAIDLSQLQQRQQMANAQASDLCMSTAVHIFAGLVVAELLANPDAPPENEKFSQMADKARLVAPFIAKSYGIIEYSLTVTPNPKS